MKRELVRKLLEQFSTSESVAEVVDWSRTGEGSRAISGLRGGSAAALAAALHRQAGRPVLIVTSTLERAEGLTDGIEFFGERALLFPAYETLPFETDEPALHIASSRSRVLHDLVRRRAGQAARSGEKSGDAPPPDVDSPPPLIVAPIDALLFRIPPAERLARLSVEVEWGQATDIDELARRLVEIGYARESMVESPGEFSIRGTIVDIYPPDAELPMRLDFFGDEIESIRRFDPVTQRSVPVEEEIERVTILTRANIEPATEMLAEGESLATLFDLLPENTLIVWDGPGRIDQRIEYFEGVAERHWDEIKAHKNDEEGVNFFIAEGLKPESWILDADEAHEKLQAFTRLSWLDLGAEIDDAARDTGEDVLRIGAQSFENVTPDFKEYVQLIADKQGQGFRVAIVCDNPGQEMRLDELLMEHRISAVIVERSETGDAASGNGADPARSRVHAPPGARDVAILAGDLQEGFIFPEARLLILTDREIFGRYRKRRVYRRAYHGQPLRDPTEIKRGDYVVHVDHGIGLFERMRRQTIDGRPTEFLEISYQEGDKLLVPVEKLHLIQKYAAADGNTPTLDKLGHKRWARRRKKTAEAVRKLAGELLELYARREASHREPFTGDTVWQQEFEASFVYQETPDQMKAIKEVKADLMSDRPADRLVCGDVGYGKTEVAIRAAFKALVENKQVAVLVPTTILAQQHYRTFTERLAGFPFRVEVVSRFHSAAQNREILEGVATGEVNLIIGTHRLLSKDVKFKELGLLVIDEEQRFGVKQKEKIKAFKPSVDVITLTATPIPRTLHMALAKLRDLSIIMTPPADRLPIKTRTIYFEKEQIEEAILRELNRDGQVYFIHNRIANIEDVAQSIRDIVPQARVAVGHGQMDEGELEQIMMDFIEHKYDILLSTTIVENGIDIPNVNTIIINRADAFGLAQLYQLRGRVGRNVRQAYAYLIVPRGQAITDTATKRLTALEEFTELGMGFNVAMRDMEIRGTGNILGGEQSGAITDVGFDLYCQLLEEAVQELKGEVAQEPLWQTEVKWPSDQWLPEEFIPVEAQRIRFYRELASARSRAAVEMVQDELLDRYGTLPPEGVNLLNAFRVKLSLAAWHVDVVKYIPDGRIRLSGCDRARELAEALGSVHTQGDWLERISYRSDGTVMLHLYVDEDEERDLADQHLKLFAELTEGLEDAAVVDSATAGASR